MLTRVVRRGGFCMLLAVLSLLIPVVAHAIQCNECHGTVNPPDLRPLDDTSRNIATGGFPGSHRLHMDETATAATCSRCHPGSGSYTPGHRNGLISVRFDSQPTSVYRNGSSSFPQRSQQRLGSCSDVSCHSDGTSVATGAAASGTTPVWGSYGLLGCDSCHGTPPGYANGTPKANAHLKHNFYGYSCNVCHYATTRNGTTISSYSSSHGNRAYDVAAPSGSRLGYSFSASGGSCSATYCHSTAQGTGDPTQPPVYRTVSWGQQFGEGCHACHYAGTHWENFIPPMATGSHKKHLDFDPVGGCTLCHYSPFYDGKADCFQCHKEGEFYIHRNESSRGPEHANGRIDVSFHPNFPVGSGAGGTYTGDPTPRTPYGTCNNIYCHSQGTRRSAPFDQPNVTDIRWGGSLQRSDCTGCHGGDSLSAVTMGTGSHPKHDGSGCATCHTLTASGNRSAIAVSPIPGYSIHTNKSYHANGYVNVAMSEPFGGRYGTETTSWDKLPGTPPLRCTNVYCHSSGVRVATGSSLFGNISTPVWGGGPMSCAACHGYPPAYLDGIPKANGHLGKHAGVGCNNCHFEVTHNGTSIADRSRHANFSYDVAAGSGISLSYAYSSRGGSCSGVSCHNDQARAYRWTISSCFTCHNAPPDNPAHIKHLVGSPAAASYGNASSTSRIAFNCGTCHPLDGSRHRSNTTDVELYNTAAAAGSLKSLNSTLSKYSSSGQPILDERGVSYRNGSCSNIYCHSNGTSIASGLAAASAAVIWNGTGTGCGGCHGNPPAYPNGTPKSNDHSSHAVYSCELCHYQTTMDGVAIADPFRHVNGLYDVTSPPASGLNYTFNAGGSVCSATYCHSNGTYIATGLVTGGTTVTWGGGVSLSCTSCHEYPPVYPNGSPKANSHGKHDLFACSTCHYLTTRDNATIYNTRVHNNRAYSVSPTVNLDMSYTYDPGGGYCNNTKCHSNGTIVSNYGQLNEQRPQVRWGETLTCTSCHSYPPDYPNGNPKANSHGKHARFACQTCHYATTTNGTTITDRNKHLLADRYFVQASPGIYFTYNFNRPGGSCTAVSCHNDGTHVVTNSNPCISSTWGENLTCGSCHGYPPNYPDGNPKNNSHAIHASYGCQICHYGVTADGTTIASQALHANNSYELKAGPGVTFTYNFSVVGSGSTCSNVSCHTTAARDGIVWSNTCNPVITLSQRGGITSPITVSFSEPMEPSSFTPQTFKVYNLDVPVNGNISYDSGSRTVSFTPVGTLEYDTPYYVTLDTGVKNLALQPLRKKQYLKYETTLPFGYSQILKESFTWYNDYGKFNHFTPGFGWYAINGGYGDVPYFGGHAWGYAMYGGDNRILTSTSSYWLVGYSKVELRFMSVIENDGSSVADVDICTQGTLGPWTNVWRRTSAGRSNEFVDISSLAAGGRGVAVRFRLYGGAGQTNSWRLDEVSLIAKP